MKDDYKMNLLTNWKTSLLSALIALSLAACSSIDLGPDNMQTEAGETNGSQSAPADPASGSGTASSTVKGVELNNKQEAPKAETEELAKVIYFDFDSFALKDEFAAIIAGHARALVTDRTLRMVLAGHTDDRGSREYNLALGQQRAEAVKRALLLLGAQELQVEAISYGEEKPESLGADEVSWAKNRRVEISYR